jgi:putative ABC transport system ATP-binding protein
MQGADPTIRLEEVRKTFRLGGRQVEALRGVSLRIDRPGCYGIMGPSGSGKSTLLHLMAALDRPDSGIIEVAGQRLDLLGERRLTEFRRRSVGLVFQQFNLISTLTALDNVVLPAMLDGMPRRTQLERGAALLDALGLTQRAHHRPDALSGGEQQRVAIARALLFEPAVLMADEPTGNLDSETSRQLWDLLRRLAAERSMTLVVVTHEPAAAAQCDRVFLLRDGVIRGSFDVEGMDAGELASRAHRDLR